MDMLVFVVLVHKNNLGQQFHKEKIKMDALLNKVHYLSPDNVSRLFNLIRTFGKPEKVDVIMKTLQLIIIKKDVKKLDELVEKIEKQLVAKTCNIIVRGVPSFGEESDTGHHVPITHDHLMDTFLQFGDVSKLQIIKGNAYVQMSSYDDARYLHNKINKMMMGNSIIRTDVV